MLSEPTKNGSAFLKRASQAAGFSAWLLPNFSELTTSGIARLHTAVPLTGVAWANIFDIAIVAVFAALVFAALRRAFLAGRKDPGGGRHSAPAVAAECFSAAV